MRKDNNTDRRPQSLVYSVKQASAMLGVSPYAYYEAVKRGELPGIRVGRLIKVPKQALARVLEPVK